MTKFFAYTIFLDKIKYNKLKLWERYKILR